MGHDPLEEMANAIDRETVMLREGSPEWMRKRIATLEAQLAEREADRERLNYYDAIADAHGCGWSLASNGLPYMRHKSRGKSYDTIREALDAACGEEGSGDD